jgi:hypothetical protein
MRESLQVLASEGFEPIVRLTTAEAVAAVSIRRERA